jgi:hypothetical protein
MAMSTPAPPLRASFLQHLSDLEAAYIRETDPIKQSGFNGGPGRWRAERSPILRAVPASGSLLDVGCANGYLLQCLVRWGLESGLTLTPFGVDCSARLIAIARQRLTEVVAPGGRLILGAYGSRSRRERPARLDEMLTELGYRLSGSVAAGDPETARFAWIDVA